MSAICLLDTSIFVEILNIPKKAQKHTQVLAELTSKIEKGESLFLPMTSIIETGNHIGQNGDGGLRRKCAERFIKMVGEALEGHSPFQPLNFLEAEHMKQWLREFPDHACTGSGLGDLTIIHDWKRTCELSPRRRVYVWSLDEHLSAYDTQVR
jgi:hypothetical protein